MSGFQLGLSYAPDAGERGQTATFTDTDGTSFEDVFSGGVSYNHALDNGNVGVSATFESGSNEIAGAEDLEAWALGLHFGMAGFNFAGSYADVGESISAASGFDGGFWTLGAGYDFDSFGISATYMDSEQEVAGGDNEFTNLSLGADYNMAPGMTPYIEVSVFEYDAPGTASDNDGTVFIVGTQLAF